MLKDQPDFVDTIPTARSDSSCYPATKIGEFFIRKYQARLAKSGQAAVLKQLQKQGVPPEIATALLYAK